MIVLNQSATSESVIVTLDEKRIIVEPYYLFVFTSVTTKEVINWIVNSTDDESPFPSRYNEFLINTSVVFAGHNHGQFNYAVYEQTSDTNTDITGLNEVENGKLELKKSATTKVGYEPTTGYTGYAG